MLAFYLPRSPQTVKHETVRRGVLIGFDIEKGYNSGKMVQMWLTGCKVKLRENLESGHSRIANYSDGRK